MPTMTADRRVFERIEGELNIRYALHNDYKEIFSTVTKNVSGGGIRTTLIKKLDLGTLLDLEIAIHEGDVKIRFKGKVAWVRNEPMDKEKEEFFEAGIEFINQKLLYIGKVMGALETCKL